MLFTQIVEQLDIRLALAHRRDAKQPRPLVLGDAAVVQRVDQVVADAADRIPAVRRPSSGNIR